MTNSEWIAPVEAALKDVLNSRKDVLDSWRRAIGNTSDGGVRKFEGWLAMELLHRLSALSNKIAYNHFVSPSGTSHLFPRQSHGSYTPDLSFELRSPAMIVSIELKTQAYPDCRNDLDLLRRYNSHFSSSNDPHRAGLVWLFLIADGTKLKDSLRARFGDALRPSDIIRMEEHTNWQWVLIVPIGAA